MRKWVCNGVEFNVGDRVRVMRTEEDYAPNGMGEGVEWLNSWIPADDFGACGSTKNMDGYLGLEFIIEEITQHGVYFESYEYVGGESYALPLSSLDKVVV